MKTNFSDVAYLSSSHDILQLALLLDDNGVGVIGMDDDYTAFIVRVVIFDSFTHEFRTELDAVMADKKSIKYWLELHDFRSKYKPRLQQ